MSVGYAVICNDCGYELIQSKFYDVAERYAELHGDAHDHEVEVKER